jgi:signal transduction histidine kinase
VLARLRRTPLVVDGALALGLFGVGLWAGYRFQPEDFRQIDGLGWVLCAAANLPLAARQRAPVMALSASCAGTVAYILAGYYPPTIGFGPLLGLYSVAAISSAWVTAFGAALTAATILFHGLATSFSIPLMASQAVVATSIATYFGVGKRRLAQANARLRELTGQLRHEREERARNAVAGERMRMARELHDVVAHHMSVVSVQAGLAQYVWDEDRRAAREAVETIADTSQEAMLELRRMLSVLRVSQAEEHPDGRTYDPTPGLGRLAEVVDRIRTAGVPVELAVEGETRPLSPGAELCAYRVVQESLTNVLKHAPSSRAKVEVSYQRRQVLIRISDDGPGPAPSYRDNGFGLLGMHERALLYGGTLEVGPGEPGGFAVALALPYPSS